MREFLAVPSVAAFAVCCTVLCFEMMAVGIATALTRQKKNIWLNEEDARRFAGSLAEFEQPDVARLLRLHRNQLENFLPFFALGSLWLATAGSAAWGTPLFVAFTTSRTLHAVCYLARLGRLRTGSFTLGVVVLLALGVGVGWRAFSAPRFANAARLSAAKSWHLKGRPPGPSARLRSPGQATRTACVADGNLSSAPLGRVG